VTTVTQMTDRILLSMEGSTGPQEIDVSNGSLDATELVVTSTNGVKGLRNGAIIEIDDELMRVVSVATLAITVIRAQYGSTGATHANGAQIRVNPRNSRTAVYQNMKEEIDGWPYTIFQVATTAVTVSATSNIMVYEVLTSAAEAAEFIRKLKITMLDPSSTNIRRDKAKGATILKELPPGDFTSTMAMQLTGKRTGYTQYDIVYAKRFDTRTAWAAGTVLESGAGIPVHYEDIIEFGTMGRLLVGKESRRVVRNRQGQPKDAQQVREGTVFQTAQAYRQLAAERIKQESLRLLHDWPMQIG